MADLPTYSFLPWARQGLAVRISETDTLGASNGATLERAQLIARLDLKHKNVDDVENISSITKTLTMVGPGDVTGFKSAAIIRTQPRNGITNFEANGMAYIEFYEEDFLWRYTPAAPANTGATTKLRPWLALVALKDDEYNIVANPSGLAYISIKQDAFNGAFHHQNDHWAFGHVHFNHKLTHTQNGQLKAEINTELKGNPDVALSRLLCPRKLQKNTSYHCFLIPAFETGRLNGLGIETTGIAAQTPSWKKGAMPASSKRPFDFPVFHQWWFRTGNYGDFESLATILKPIIIDKEQGKMPMDIQDPGFNLQAKNEGSKVIGLEAALKPVDMKKDKWPTNGTDNVEDITTVDELKKLLSLSADFVDPAAIISSGQVFFSAKITEDPILVPPIYGVWHALVDKLDKPATPKWVKELNLDFRNRAVAGAGATIIQQKQEDLMNRAWQQVDRVNEANKKIQMAELAKLIAGAIMKKSMINAGGDKSYLITNSVQHLILNQAKTQTIQQDFIDSRIPVAAKTAAFRKLTRPANKTATANKVMAAAVSKPLLVNITTIIDQFNKAESDVQAVRGARLKEAPIGALSLTAIGTAISKAVTDYEGDPKNIAVNNFVEIIKTHVLNANASLTKVQLQQEGNAVAGLSAAAKQLLTDFISNIATEPVKATAGHVTVLINHAFFSGQFTDGISSKIIDNIILKDNTAPAVTAANTMASLDDLKNIQSSFATFNTNVMALPLQKELPAFSNIATTAKTLFSRLSPEVTFASKLASSIRIWKNGVYVPLRKLKPIMAHPEFTEAVYNYFLAISKNYILPNIDKIPNNSITLLQNNQSFIESAMAGLNHEMARELLWREYPTDQRGSYFRQFWNISDTITVTSVDAEKEKEQKLDIKKMHEWDNALGGNCPRPNSDNIVLIIRGDLLKKYSNTVVYAQRAEYAADPTLPRKLKGDIDGTEIKFPLFKADIDPDITLFGFDLQPNEAAGERIENTSTPIAGKNPGWFFVLKERPGQVNFGMDDFTDEHGNTELMPPAGTKPKDWNDLAWEYLVNSKAELADYHLNFSKTITITENANQAVWGSNAADMAAILLQDPALIARHAAEMLPEDF